MLLKEIQKQIDKFPKDICIQITCTSGYLDDNIVNPRFFLDNDMLYITSSTSEKSKIIKANDYNKIQIKKRWIVCQECGKNCIKNG